MDFNLKSDFKSWKDIRDGIILPQRPTLQLCELIGIIAGDGSIASDAEETKDYRIQIYANAFDEFAYFMHTKSLVKQLFNLNMKDFLSKSDNTIYLLKRSKAVFYFLKNIGYEKIDSLIKVLSWIWETPLFVASFVRGLFDTDGCLALKNRSGKFYPVISIGLKDGGLLKLVKIWLESNRIPCVFCREQVFDERTNKIYIKFRLEVNGYRSANEFLQLVGTCNIKNIKKMGPVRFEFVKPQCLSHDHTISDIKSSVVCSP